MQEGVQPTDDGPSGYRYVITVTTSTLKLWIYRSLWQQKWSSGISGRDPTLGGEGAREALKKLVRLLLKSIFFKAVQQRPTQLLTTAHPIFSPKYLVYYSYIRSCRIREMNFLRYPPLVAPPSYSFNADSHDESTGKGNTKVFILLKNIYLVILGKGYS